MNTKEPLTTTIPTFRISSRINSLIEVALKKLNEKSLMEIKRANFIRFALMYFCKDIIEGKPIPKLEL